jgi:hypothetical protein
MEKVDLLRLIREKLADGRLPHNSIARVWGRAAANEVCVACDRATAQYQFVMEGIGAAMKAFQFHVRCFYYWDSVRKLAGRYPLADPGIIGAPPIPPDAPPTPKESAPPRTLWATAAGSPSLAKRWKTRDEPRASD